MSTFVQTVEDQTTSSTPDKLFLDYVDPASASPRTATGYIGGIGVTVVVADDFDPVRGDIVDLSIGDDGLPTATQKLGHAAPVTGGITERLPPRPADLVNIGAGYAAYGSLGFGQAPPLVVTSTPDGLSTGETAEYGNVGALETETYVWYGHQVYNYFTPFFLRFMVLNLTVATLDPADMTIDLLDQFAPGGPVTVRDSATITGLTYEGAGPVWRWLMPNQWVLDFANGDAGALRLRPADSIPGITGIHVGRYGSLSVGPLLPDEEPPTEGTLTHA